MASADLLFDEQAGWHGVEIRNTSGASGNNEGIDYAVGLDTP